jgi:hypothetical protein
MDETEEQFRAIAGDIKNLCTHVSVRRDENGPYVFALGLREIHTLQMRRIGRAYVLELWCGENAEVEKFVEEPVFSNIEAAFAKAKEWLVRDQ